MSFWTSFFITNQIQLYRSNTTRKPYNWLSALKHLTAYCNGYDVPLDKVDDEFLEGFKKYLLGNNKSVKRNYGQLSQNSALSYFNKERVALKEAYNCKMIKDNPVYPEENRNQ